MKKISTLLRTGSIAFLVTVLLGSCLKDKFTKTYSISRPVYQTRQQVLASVKSNAPVEISTPGKIYIYGNYIFLNELNQGVHIIDNENPAAPKNIGFINIPGNIDIAVKGDVLYADMYADLLTIDISNPADTRLLHSMSKLFPERFYGPNFSSDTSRIIVGWTTKDTMVDVGTEVSTICRNCFYNFAVSPSSQSNQSVPGLGGSMARFSIVNDYLYAVGAADLAIVSIANRAAPEQIGVENIGMNIETIYPFRDKLFIGSSTGMFIYNISDPAKPVKESAFEHIRACDPVVADDNYAYVTLRTGTACAGNVNELQVINVKNVAAPSLVKSYPLTNPHGLAIDKNILFVCDGREGLRVYNTADANNLAQIGQLKGIETYDAIAWNKTLMVVTTGGLNQYDYSNPANLRLLSTIRINKRS